MPEINIAFNADASRFKNAVSEINQTVKQTFVDVRNSFSSVNNTFNSTNKTLNVTNNRFVSINNAVRETRTLWERLSASTAAIRNSFRIEVVNAAKYSHRDFRAPVVLLIVRNF